MRKLDGANGTKALEKQKSCRDQRPKVAKQTKRDGRKISEKAPTKVRYSRSTSVQKRKKSSSRGRSYPPPPLLRRLLLSNSGSYLSSNVPSLSRRIGCSTDYLKPASRARRLKKCATPCGILWEKKRPSRKRCD